jgi:hypothetical protein
MISTFFLIGEYLTIKEIDNCIQVSKGLCQEIVNAKNIKNKRYKHVINNQRVLINAYLLKLKRSYHDDIEYIDDILVNFKKTGYKKTQRKCYINLLKIKDFHDDSIYNFIKNEILLTKIEGNIPCLNY